jgi:hypothetical protein
MNQTMQPAIDLGAEAGIAPLEFLLVATLAGLALAYLLRGFLKRRAKAVSGEGCTGCPGCSSTGSCPSVTQFKFDRGESRRTP